MTRASRVIMVVALAACGNAPATTTTWPAPAAGHAFAFDHVIIGIDSLERGMQLLEEMTGVKPIVGGVHPGRGTRNALLSLGDHRYLELMAPNPAEPVESEQVKQLRGLRSLTPIGWAIHVSNADMARRTWTSNRLSPSAPVPGSRLRPDGRLLKWRTLDPFGVASPVLPFAIEWDSTSVHPATDAPQGCSLSELSITAHAATSVYDLLRRAAVDVPVERGATDAIAISFFCPRGRVDLP